MGPFCVFCLNEGDVKICLPQDPRYTVDLIPTLPTLLTAAKIDATRAAADSVWQLKIKLQLELPRTPVWQLKTKPETIFFLQKKEQKNSYKKYVKLTIFSLNCGVS